MSTARGIMLAAAAAALVGVLTILAATPTTSAAYIARITNPANTLATAPYFTCAAAAASDRTRGYFQYALNETSRSTTAADSSTAANPGTYRGTMATSSAALLGCPRDARAAYVLDGSSSYVSSAKSYANPTAFSIEVWFQTTVAGGKLIGFGNAQTGSSGNYDRHLYVETTGKLDFGTYNGRIQVISTPGSVTDGRWHHAVGTMSASTGMRLYLDGSLVASNTTFTTPQNYTGYWRVGYDNLNGWRNQGSRYYYTGQLRYAAAYSVVLTPAQVQQRWAAGQ